MHHPVFVYGTLMPGHHNHGHCLRGQTTIETPAVVDEIGLFCSATLPYAAPALGRLTHGYLVHLRKDTYANTMRSLDLLEGYRPKSKHSHYVRATRFVRFTDPTTGHAGRTQAWVYLAGPDIDIPALQPVDTGRWTDI